MLDLGYKNYIDENQIRSIILPNTSHGKWLRKEAIAGRVLIDCTQGRKTNTIVILTTGHIALSSLKLQSIVRRLQSVSHDIILRLKSRPNIRKEILSAINKIESEDA